MIVLFFFVVSVFRDRCQTKRTTHQLLARLSHCKYDFDCLDFSSRLFWIFAQIKKNSNGRFRGVVNSFGEISAMLSNSTNAMQWEMKPFSGFFIQLENGLVRRKREMCIRRWPIDSTWGRWAWAWDPKGFQQKNGTIFQRVVRRAVVAFNPSWSWFMIVVVLKNDPSKASQWLSGGNLGRNYSLL